MQKKGKISLKAGGGISEELEFSLEPAPESTVAGRAFHIGQAECPVAVIGGTVKSANVYLTLDFSDVNHPLLSCAFSAEKKGEGFFLGSGRAMGAMDKKSIPIGVKLSFFV